MYLQHSNNFTHKSGCFLLNNPILFCDVSETDKMLSVQENLIALYRHYIVLMLKLGKETMQHFCCSYA